MMKESKKTILLLFAMAMIVTFIPSLSESAYAETVMEPPTSNTYIDGSELTDADMNYGLTTGKKAQAVYFGTNRHSGTYENLTQPQKWWIAGFDKSGLVLMCDPQQPLKTRQRFNLSTQPIQYQSDFGVYESSPTKDLHPNHYGASDIREVLNDLATDESYFTQAEQSMMKETTVYTYDCQNSTAYSTTDKLYLAAGCHRGEEITVGKNAIDSSQTGNKQVHNGLIISLKGSSLYGSPFTDSSSCNFWTRSPDDYSYNVALEAIPSQSVQDGEVNQPNYAVVPAFALDSGNVLFASAAPAGESYTEIDEKNKTMTFRCDGRDRINSTATFTGNSVAVHYDDSDADFYLYVQGRDSAGDWVFSQKIEWEADFPASFIRPGANLTNCKVWLETVEDNIAYAKPAQFTGAFPPPLYGIVTPPTGKKYTYTGKLIHGVNPPIGSCASGFACGTSVGIYYCDVMLDTGYMWSDGTTAPKTIKWQILKAPNPMKLKTKTATVKKSAVKKKAQKLKRTKVLTFTKSAKGKVTYTKVSGSNKLSIAKSTGTVTVKKKTKKGTYSIKVRVKAAGNGSYKALSKTVTLKVRVK